MYKILEQNYVINAPKEVVWSALTDPKHIEEWSNAPATMDDQEGTSFKLWNGDVHGKNIEVMAPDELVQEWYGGKWEKPSTVTLTLSTSNGKTTVHLLQEDIPEDEFESIEDGWKEYYFEPLKEYVESELV